MGACTRVVWWDRLHSCRLVEQTHRDCYAERTPLYCRMLNCHYQRLAPSVTWQAHLNDTTLIACWQAAVRPQVQVQPSSLKSTV